MIESETVDQQGLDENQEKKRKDWKSEEKVIGQQQEG